MWKYYKLPRQGESNKLKDKSIEKYIRFKEKMEE